MLHRYLLRKTRDNELSSDLVQETFLRVAERDQQEQARFLPSYIFKIADNLLIDHSRKAWVRKTDSVPDEVLASVVDEHARPDEDALRAIELQQLKTILRGLPVRSRQVFLLCRLEGWTYGEVAEHLDISVSSVRKDLAQAMEYVVKRL